LFVGLAIVEDVNARTYRPRFVIDESGVMEYSDAPLRQQERNKKGPSWLEPKQACPRCRGRAGDPPADRAK